MEYDDFVMEELRKVYGNQVNEFLSDITKPNPRLYVRVNTILADPADVAEELGFMKDEDFKEAIYTPIKGPFKVEINDGIVIVDKKTAESVMVGADVFRPGVKKIKGKTGQRVTVVSERGDPVGEGELVNSYNVVVRVDNSLYSSVKIAELLPLKEGKIYVQGKSSMYVAKILDPRPGELIVDMNAAPGGKLTHIAQLQPKARILGFDHTSKKVDKIRELLSRMKLPAQVFEADSRYLYEDFNLKDVDKVIIDPPCSAMGLRPKLYDKKTGEDLITFSRYQKQFLNSAFKVLKKGGTVVYSTCTVTELENEKVIDDPRFEVEYQIRFHPMQGMTGFFIAKLVKNNDMPLEDFMGKYPRINGKAYLHPTSYVIGDVEIGEMSSVWHYVIIRGDNDSISIGSGSNVQENSSIHTDPGFKVTIGDKVTIGHNAVVHGASISSNVIVGMGSILLNGSKVGEFSIVGAGSVVTEGKEIPPYSLALGVPARVVRKLKEEEIKVIEENAEEYINHVKRFLSNG